jgi:hypothetical protein
VLAVTQSNGECERTEPVHSAHSRHQVATAKDARAAVAAPDRLASVDGPQMPARLAAKVTDAIKAESARRQLIPAH